jgi:hypothetical protein
MAKRMLNYTLDSDRDAMLQAMRSNKPQVIRFYDRFAVVGTAYGHLHTTSGDWATWKTASGARKAIKRYVPL